MPDETDYPLDSAPQPQHPTAEATQRSSSRSAKIDLDEWRRLRPPARGDTLAGGLLLLALILFLSSLSVLTRAGVVSWRSDIPLLSELNYLSLGLVLGAFLWSWGKDWRWLHAEERDIAGLFANPDAQQDPGLVLHRGHSASGPRRVETLLDDRVARVLATQKKSEGRAPLPVRESELRAVAAWRSASVGSLARYVSGLLLLFTVLGTFLGVKSSLGPLRDALLQSATGTAAASALATPLGNVAAAFGANLTALVGAITLGLGAWALSVGRQNMLARLEQVSSVFVYPQIKHQGPVEQLASAAEQIGNAGTSMSISAQELSGVKTAITKELGGVREAMVGQLGVLTDSVGDFSASIDDSLKQTRQMLQALLVQQAAQVADDSRRNLDKVERQITDTVTAVQQATTLYAAMVGRLESDVEVTATGSRVLGEAVAELREARTAFGHYADSATRTIDERLGKLARSSEDQLSVSRRTYSRYRKIDRNLTSLVSHVGSLAEAIAASEQRRAQLLAEIEERTAMKVADHLQPAFVELRDTMSTLHDTVTGLPNQVGRAVAEALRQNKAPAPGGEDSSHLVDTLRRLAESLEGMERRANRPLLRKIFGRGAKKGR